jgi:superfamily II DNA or RNA helicase
MNQLLAAIQQERGLASWLRSGLWKRGFDRGSLSRAEDYATASSIIYQDVEHLPGDGVIVEAKVHGTQSRPYLTRVGFFTNRDSWKIEAECTCPVGLFCKHSAALVIHLLETLMPSPVKTTPIPQPQRLDSNIASWLAQLALATEAESKPSPSSAKPKTQEKRFLAFCIVLQPFPSNPSWLFEMRVGRILKDDSFEITDTKANADATKPPKYMTREDFIPASLYHQRFRKYSLWHEMRLELGDWEDLFDAAHATGHLYQLNPANRTWNPVTFGPPVKADATWDLMPNGNAKPILQTAREDIIILHTIPPRYLDPNTGTIGLLEGNQPASILNTWSKAPVIPVTQLPQVAERLSLVAPLLPQPGADETIERPVSPPSPHLKIFQKTLSLDGEFESFILGLITFTYGDSPPLTAMGKAAPPCHIAKLDGKRILWKRNPAAELERENQLKPLGLIPFDEAFPYDRFDQPLPRAVITRDPGPSDYFAWLDLIESGALDQLKSLGWTIEIDPSARLTVHEITDFNPEIEQDGIDWFRFDLSTEINGKRISLIPHIASAIESGLLNALPYEEPTTPEPPTPTPSLTKIDGNFEPFDEVEDEDYYDEDDDHTPFTQIPTRLPKHFIIPCDDPADGVIRFPSARFIEICHQVAHLFQGHTNPDGPLKIDRLAAADAADALNLASNETTRALAELSKRLKNLDSLPLREIPKSVRADLRSYQQEGFRWLQFLARNQLNGILADDMGLGKTLQTLAHLAAEHESKPGRPSLVIAPTSVVPNWRAEAAKFTPNLKVLTLHGKDRSGYFDCVPTADIVLTSYPLLSRDIAEFEKHDFHTVVLDEAQYIKNPKSIVAQSACKLKTAHRLCLSGTPMENHLGELWSLMRFLMPGFLGDEKTFNSRVRRPIEKQKSKDAQIALNRRVSPLILRRTKDQVATELPAKTIIVHHVELTKKQTDLYESVRAAMDVRVREAIASQGLAKSHIIVLDALLKLRQICCHPQLLSIPAAAKITDSAKLDYLTDDLLPTLIGENRRILLFSSFTSMLERIEAHLTKSNIPYLKLTGQTKDRATLVKQFQQGHIPIFLISLKAGGTGLNLTAADTVIHYDPWWNPAAENQATDRAHRIGQTKPVFVHKLVCRGTIEDRILELQQHKAALVEALLSDETSSLKLDQQTLSHLFAPL